MQKYCPDGGCKKNDVSCQSIRHNAQVEFSGYGFFVQPYSRSRPDFRVGQPTGGHVLSRHVMPMSNSFLHLYEHIGLIIAYASLVAYNCIDLF